MGAMKTRQRLGAVAALVGLVLLAACTDDAGGSAEPTPTPTATDTVTPQATATPESPQSAFVDALRPVEEITVGRHRYVSPCQLLPWDVAARFLGEITTSSNGVYETTWEESPTRARNGLPWVEEEASCRWYNGLRNERSLTVRLTQSADADAAERLAVYRRLPNDAADAFRRWKRADLSTLDDGGRTEAFREQLRGDLQSYRSAAKDYGFSGPELDGVVVATESGLGDSFVFAGNEKNVTWQLEADGWPGQGTRAADPTYLAAASVLVTTLRERLADPALDQAPAPTILGDAELLGNTPLLEPCLLLDRAVFRRGTALRQNGTTERSVAPVRPDLPDDLGRRTPAASCTRTFQADRAPKGARQAMDRLLGSTGSLDVDIRVVYLPTEQAAKEFYRATDPGPKLATKADAAHLWTSTDTVVSRVGNYAVFLGTQALASCDSPALTGRPCDLIEEVTVPRSVILRTFNAVVPKVRAEAAERAPDL